MITRTATSYLKKLAAGFRSVAVVGPRQSGKTTLCKTVFPKKLYVSLENTDTREFAMKDPRSFLREYKDGAILDEVQKAPELFSYLQQVLDETKKSGLFILTGSNNFLMQENISQTLAGRVGYLHLLPLSIHEIESNTKLKKHYSHHIFNGCYPEVVTKSKVNAYNWYANYINTYIERDVRQLKNIGNLSMFLKFTKLCAGRTGQILNLTSLGSDCGIDQKTAGAWLSILQSSYVVMLLSSYNNNFNRRIIKSPKMYFYDTGVACSLLGIENEKQLVTHHSKGSLFENFIIIDMLKARYNKGLSNNLYYFRDKTGNEVDVIADTAGKLTATEIKSGETISTDFFGGLNFFENLQSKPIQKVLIYGGNEKQERSNKIKIKPWNDIY
ncbi:MAG: ATP-binding protein [Bacteroidia bacterium]